MPKITFEDIAGDGADNTGLGFKKELFRIATDAAFRAFVDAIISKQSLLLAGEVGSSLYAVTTSPTHDFLHRAEECKVAAEMVQRRINIILANSSGSGKEIDISHEGAQKKAYRDEAAMWIHKTLDRNNAGDDLSFGVLVTSHFQEQSTGGQESA